MVSNPRPMRSWRARKCNYGFHSLILFSWVSRKPQKRFQVDFKCLFWNASALVVVLWKLHDKHRCELSSPLSWTDRSERSNPAGVGLFLVVSKHLAKIACLVLFVLLSPPRCVIWYILREWLEAVMHSNRLAVNLELMREFETWEDLWRP